MGTKTGKFEEIRRSPPEKVAEHQRWAPYAVKGASLAELRQLCGKTQEEVGRAMGISGVEAGRMEKRTDVQVSTLVRFLASLGGELEVYARFDEKLVPLRVGVQASNARAGGRDAPWTLEQFVAIHGYSAAQDLEHLAAMYESYTGIRPDLVEVKSALKRYLEQVRPRGKKK